MGNGFVLVHSSSGSLVPAVEEEVKLAIGSKLMNQIDSIHPGEHLAEILDELGISQYRLAKAIDVPPRRINEIVHGRRSITADTALRIGQALGMTPEFWLNLQKLYDLDLACISKTSTTRRSNRISHHPRSTR